MRAERLRAGIPDGYLPFAPDLAVEVMSPGDRRSDVMREVNDYLDAGTALVLLFSPRSRSVRVFTPRDRSGRALRVGDTLDGGDVAPGFQIPIAELFA